MNVAVHPILREIFNGDCTRMSHGHEFPALTGRSAARLFNVGAAAARRFICRFL